MYSQMQIDDEKVYVASESNKIYALNINDQASIDWEYQTEYNYADIDENTILDNGTYYFAAKNKDKKPPIIKALNSSNGELIWKSNLTNKGNNIKFINKYDNYIFGFTDAEVNSFFLINASNGEQIKIKEPKEKIISNIFASNGDLFFLTKNLFVSFNLKSHQFSYRELKLDYKINDSFNLYFEIVKAQK